MQSTVTLGAAGLNTQPNQLEVPPGGMTAASNVVIQRKDVVEPRRGFKLYGNSFGSSSDRLKQLLFYKNTIIRHWGDTLEYDTGAENNAGTELFQAFAGTYTEPQVGLRIKYVESNGNLYFTTSQGIQKISATGANQFTTSANYITPAGGVKALDVQATIVQTQGEQTGFLPNDSTVAYRVVWGTNDANQNLVLGVPSQRAEVYNYFINPLLLDYNTTLNAIQNVANRKDSLIYNPDYFSLLNLPTGSTALDLYNNLISLSSKLDANLLIANSTGTNPDPNNFNSVPLTISNVAIVTTASGNTCTITFSSGNPLNYFIVGSNIYLAGFPTTLQTGTINGAQVITSVTATTLTFSTTATAQSQTFTSASVNPQINVNFTASDVSLSTAGTNPSTFTIPNHGFTSASPVTFSTNTSNGGVLPSPIVAGSTYYVGNVTTNTFQIYADVGLTALVSIGSSGTDPSVGHSTISSTQTNRINIPNHGFANNAPVRFTTTGALPSITTVTNSTPTPLSTNTTYYVGNVTTNNFQLFLDVNLTQPISFTTSTGTGVNTVSYYIAITGSTLTGYDFSKIAQPTAPQESGATDADYVAIQTYLQAILTQLSNELTTGSPPIISSTGQSLISNISLTADANVQVTLSIPSQINSNYFVQVYRSAILQATGTAQLSDYVASDEMQLIYEATPTPAQLAAGVITFLDSTSPQFAGANLYTNPDSGIGIANAYEVPPLALDINRFKNVVFYANTTTRYIETMQLLGVSKMLQDYNSGTTPKITIANGKTTNTYSFIAGKYQSSAVTCTANTANSLDGKYFLLNSADNTDLYYVWYSSSTAADPAISGRTGIKVIIGSNDSTITVANKTANAINSGFGYDFNASTSINIASTTPGSSLTTITTAVPHGLTGTPVITIANNTTGYPLINGTYTATVTGTSTFTIPVATVEAVQTTGQGVVIGSIDVVSITNTAQGYTNATVDGNTGFTFATEVSGQGQKNSSLQVLLSSNVSPAVAIQQTANSLVQVINQNPNESVYAYYTSSDAGVPGQFVLESRTLANAQFYLLANNSDTGSSFSPNLSPTSTISSITAYNSTQALVTTSSAHGMTTGDQVVLSSTNSTPSADGLYTISYVSPTSFIINLAITGSASSGSWISGANGQAGSNENKINRVYYSQYQQPEAVPLGNYFDVGDADKPILRIFPLRDSLFVFKQEGLYVITGEVAPFNLTLFDSSVFLIAPDSVSVAKNVIYAWTTQGVLAIIESGVSNPPVSRPIDVDILKLGSANYPHFGTATWGLGYESDNSYLVFTVQDTGDTEATIGYRYSTLTQTWTTFDKTNTCGVINIADDKLYMGAGDVNYLEQERKTFTRLDYADREIDKTIVSGYLSGTNLRLPSITGIGVGDVIVQDQLLSVYDYNSILRKLDTDRGLLTSTITSIAAGVLPIVTTSSAHHLTTGNIVIVAGTNTTPNIDGTYVVTVLNSTQFTLANAPMVLTAGTVGTAKYSYINTLGAVAGVDLNSALQLLSQRLVQEPSLVYKPATVAITSNSAASPSVVTTATAHGLGPVGFTRKVNITGVTGSTPSINGVQTVTITGTNTFTVPVTVTVAGSGGSLTTIDDYENGISIIQGTITGISQTSPTVITSANHKLVSNRYIQIAGSNSSPSVDGNYIVTVIDANTFSVPINVLQAGTSGTFVTNNEDFQDIQVNYNYIVSLLNADPGTNYKNYVSSINTTEQEAIITAVNPVTSTLTLSQALDFVVGPITIFEAIDSTFTYCPVTFKDTLNLKQVAEATLMFDNKAFSTATLSFASDLLPKFNDVPFSGAGNGAFGTGTGFFGNGYFGGSSNSAPFRTYVPRDAQRCRYIVVKFDHAVARESFAINGLTLSGSLQESQRAYR